MKLPIPHVLGGARVILYSEIDERHRHTGNTKQIVAGITIEAATGLAICQYEGEHVFYLFGCDENWTVITDTWHESIEGAKAQAEFEYEGVTATWKELK